MICLRYCLVFYFLIWVISSCTMQQDKMKSFSERVGIEYPEKLCFLDNEYVAIAHNSDKFSVFNIKTERKIAESHKSENFLSKLGRWIDSPTDIEENQYGPIQNFFSVAHGGCKKIITTHRNGIKVYAGETARLEETKTKYSCPEKYVHNAHQKKIIFYGATNQLHRSLRIEYHYEKNIFYDVSMKGFGRYTIAIHPHKSIVALLDQASASLSFYQSYQLGKSYKQIDLSHINAEGFTNNHCCYHPSGNFLAIVINGTIFIVDPQKEKNAAFQKIHTIRDLIVRMFFHPNGILIVLAKYQSKLYFFNMTTHEMIYYPPKSFLTPAINDISSSPDGKRLAIEYVHKTQRGTPNIYSYDILLTPLMIFFQGSIKKKFVHLLLLWQGILGQNGLPKELVHCYAHIFFEVFRR
jgi:WD40 repeat protein